MSLPVIGTGRLELRPVASGDLDAITEQIGEFAVARMLSVVPHPYTLQDAQGWFEQSWVRQADGARNLAIDNGSGLIGVVSVGRPSETPNFGYWLGKAFWGRGYMSEAGRAALGWLFTATETQTVVSGALDENPASLKVLSKLGFENAGPYTLAIRSRGEDLPATRMKLARTAFLSAAGEAA
ncbi:GNAT family N-acetyltransferase [Labrenzia sp. 011]|uniref:GNAT family N-acetyltransferase n=1 Tax=Labrenzia sp. 011 TaxID=2171494 RepID=UPI000D516523|nr:GNAT family N-acetyltransferase [Labrenzia sp. 011]PVB60716.1 N-acetyltransferase [Labrenzia sp. 011]